MFFSYRPYSLFDTRVKFDPSNFDEPLDNIAGDRTFNSEKGSDDVESNEGNDVKRSYEGDTIIAVDSGYEVDEDSHLVFNSDGSSDSDSSSIFNCDKDYDIDDDYNTGPEETRSFLYRYYTISIIANYKV